MIASLFFAALLAVAGSRTEREDPQVNSIGRLPPRTYAMPLAAEADALTDALDPETPYRMSLNGEWRYSWAGDPENRVKDFFAVGFDDSDWFTIDVPSCVEMRGFGSPGYTNVRYPHADLSHPTNASFAAIRDRQSGKPDYNPVSSYRRTFTVPESWKGRRVILRFDGVYSAYYVWVNGKRVGYAEDSKLPSEFDVTDYLVAAKPESSPYRETNVLAVEVYRWCDGSYLEDQDMTRFSGIFRDVTLWAMPEDGIWDFAVKTMPVEGYEKWKLEVKVEGDGKQRTDVSLYDADRKKVVDLHSSPSPLIYTSTLAAQVWSAEKPYLYTLVLKKGDDIRMKRIGFKEQKIVGNRFLVNGQTIKFKGVNRHETSPDGGRTVSVREMIRDAEMMKRFNINAVRTSHYPDHHLWYDICDRYGLYVCAEANVEAHEPGYREKGLGRFPEWDHSIVERNARHVLFYRNHPSVTIWSVGNETGHGDCFRHAIAEVKRLDPTRPVHWERGNPDADVDSMMYPFVSWLEDRGKLGDGLIDRMPKPDDFVGAENRQTKGKCHFLCEYAHAMGNAVGNLQEYWDVIYRYDSLCGGCIWDWADQAIWKYTGLVGANGKGERFLAYGGDFDERPNDGPFNCNGLTDPERRVTAKLVEVGHVYRNLVVTNGADGVLALVNRNGFSFADEYDADWELVTDGVVVGRGALSVPHLGPLASCVMQDPIARPPARAGECFLNVSFRLRSDCPWAKKGWVVSRNQVPYGGGGRRVLPPQQAATPEISETGADVKVVCGGTRAVFSRRTGTLRELVMNGTCILKDPAERVVAGPRLTCARAFVDNDVWIREDPSWTERPFMHSGLSQLRYHARPIRVAGNEIRTCVEVTGAKSAGFTHESVWTFAADGSVCVSNTVLPHGTMPTVLPRLGLSLQLDGSLENVRYYGRGPYENYIDRRTGSLLGTYSTTVSDLYEPYVRPQDNGYRSDVRWFELSNRSGEGVRFETDRPMFVQALHHSLEDLEYARPRREQPRFRTPLQMRKEVFLNLDVRQLGLGGASCGPEPMEKYRFPIGRTTWTLRMSPLGTVGVVDSGTHYAEAALRPYVDSGEVPGAISVFYKDGVQETCCIGYADVESGRRITLDDAFMQCSQTKGFCGVSVAMLVENGKIDLDDPVSKYLPEFKNLAVETSGTNGCRILSTARNVLRIRHVMNHMGGFPFELAHTREMGGWSRRMPLRSVAAVAAAQPLMFEPGTDVKYSNVGLDIGAAIVEVVCGCRWERFLREKVLTPLGMNDTDFLPSEAALRRRIGLYRVKAGKRAQRQDEAEWMQSPFNDDRVFPSAGAGLWTTARDQLKFYKMLMNLGVGENGVRILQSETVRRLLAVSSRPKGMEGYSLGLNAPESDDEDGWFGHGGAWNTSCMVNWHRKQLKLWVVQFYGDQRWSMCKKERDAAAEAFFGTRIDGVGVDAYTGRLK